MIDIPPNRHLHQLKENTTYYSKVTQIFYKKTNNQLMKYCTYGSAVRGWNESAYRGEFKEMTPATTTQLKELT